MGQLKAVKVRAIEASKLPAGLLTHISEGSAPEDLEKDGEFPENERS
jgi:hypothetical protein